MITRQRAEEAAGAHGAARPCGPAGPGGERLLGGQAPVHDYTSTPLLGPVRNPVLWAGTFGIPPLAARPAMAVPPAKGLDEVCAWLHKAALTPFSHRSLNW